MPRFALAPTLALLAIAAEVQAQSADDLVRTAVELRRAGRDAEALAALEAAWRAAPSPRVRAQMGFAEQALDRWVDADAHLREALAAPDAWVTERRAIVEEALRVVEQRVGSFDVRCTTPGATLWVEGHPAMPLPLATPLRVNAGHLAYEVRAEGYATARRETVVPAGAITRDEVVLTTTSAAATLTLTPTATASPWGPQRTWALVTTAGAALGLGVGVAMLISRNAAADRWNDPTCLRNDRTRAENCADDRDALETAGAVSVASFVAGGALAVTATVLWLTAPSARRAQTFVCAPDGVARGVVCGGRF
jgi:hypothetical protein